MATTTTVVKDWHRKVVEAVLLILGAMEPEHRDGVALAFAERWRAEVARSASSTKRQPRRKGRAA